VRLKKSIHTTLWRLGAFHHVGLTVADIERSIHFYRDILGMTLFRRRPHVDSDYVALQTGYQGVVLNVASFKVAHDSPQSLELVQYMNRAGLPVETAGNRPGASHLCLSVDDLRACQADLKAKGVRFKSDPVTITAGPNTGGLVVYFYDPDGYALELFQMPENPIPREGQRPAS
jgi:catechol 2,3-dioxygenase-like lactoylglutathione lyase family enzyme